MKYGRRTYLPAIVMIFRIFIAFGNFFNSVAKTQIEEKTQNVQNYAERDSLMKAFKEIRLTEKSESSGPAEQNIYDQRIKLLASDGAENDRFGSSIAISGETAVVGSPDSDLTPNGNQSVAYVFKKTKTNFVQSHKLMASDAAASDYFGGSVAIINNTILSGAAFDDI